MKKASKPQLLTECDKFFTDVHSDLQQIVFESRVEQRKLHHAKKMNIIDGGKQNSRTKYSNTLNKQQQSYETFLASVIIDYIRAKKLNYSYNVFMRESNTISEELILRGKLAQKLGLSEEYGKYDGNKISVVELMIEKIATQKQNGQNLEHKEVQTLSSQDFSFSGDSEKDQKRRVLIENRIAEVRQQAEDREKKHYEKAIKSFKVKQSLEMKETFHKQFQERFQQWKLEHQRFSSSKTNEAVNELSVIQKQRQKDFQSTQLKLRTLEKQNIALSQKIKQYQKQKMLHKCSDSDVFREKEEKLKGMRKYLDEKSKEYELALRNMGTKIEELYQQKEIVNRETRPTDNFVRDQKKTKQTKNYIIQQIHTQMLKMEQRLQDLSQDNAKLRAQKKELEGKISHLSEISIIQNQQNSISLEFNQASHLQISEKHHQQPSRGYFIPSNYQIPKKHALIGVSQEEIESQMKSLEADQNKSDISETSEASYQIQEKITRKYQHQENVSKLLCDMKMLKSKYKFLIEDLITE